MKINFLALICIAVLCGILTLGLWPFHSPINQVAWLANQNGLHFGRNSTVIASAPFQVAGPQDSREATLEIWLQPNRIWDSGTFLAFYRPGNLFQFSLRQSQTDLLVRATTSDDNRPAKAANLHVDRVFSRKQHPVFLTITSGMKGANVYIDGVIAMNSPQFPLSAKDLGGQLVVGDSPGQNDSWSGELLGLALYHRQLTETQTLHNYITWEQTGRPDIAEDERNIALYLFDEHTGAVVRDKAHSGVDLHIPERYRVMDKIVLEPFWTEFRMSHGYWGAALKNVVGFIPLGFCFYAYLLTLLPVNRATVVTIALGTAVSLAIEILQAFLPTRESGTSDIITNTLGTWIGVALYNPLTPLVDRFFPWVPFHAPRRK